MPTSTPVLKIVNLDANFVVCTNACQQGIGGVSTYNGNFICYESRNLKEHEQNYATHDLKLVEVVHSLKIWRHYLMGNKFELITNHHGLKYLFKQPNINVRQRIWMELLCEYDFKIKHIKGK